MEDWTRVWWKVLALGVVASVIATYVVRLLDQNAAWLEATGRHYWREAGQNWNNGWPPPGVLHALIVVALIFLTGEVRERLEERKLAATRTHLPASAPPSEV